MRTLLNIYNPTTCFWAANPQWKIRSAAKKVYKADRSDNKVKSSKMMWFVAGLVDGQSNYVEMLDDEDSVHGKHKTLSKDLFDDVLWWSKHKKSMLPLIEMYEDMILTPATRAMKAWEIKMVERDEVFAATKYAIGQTDENGKMVGSNVEALDKMFERTPKIWDAYFKILAKIEGEGDDAVKGGSAESLGDTGEI